MVAMVDVTRGYITSLKGHLKGETIEEKQAFKNKHIGYDTEAIEAAIDDIQDVLDEDGGDYDEMADGIPHASLTTDTIEQEETIKRKGGKVKKPSPPSQPEAGFTQTFPYAACFGRHLRRREAVLRATLQA